MVSAMNRSRQFTISGTIDVPESAINTETLIVTLQNVSSEYPNQQALMEAWVDWVPGTTATGYIMRIRRDSLTGALVTEANTDFAAAAAAVQAMILFPDVRSGEFMGSYVLTMQGVGETVVGNARAYSLTANVN
jgi:hypothetical protein